MRITESQLRRVVRRMVNEQSYGLTTDAPRLGLPNFKADGMAGAVDITDFISQLQGSLNWPNVLTIFKQEGQGLGRIYGQPGSDIYLAYGRKSDAGFLFKALLEGLINSGATNIPGRPRNPSIPVAAMMPMQPTLNPSIVNKMPVVYGR